MDDMAAYSSLPPIVACEERLHKIRDRAKIVGS